MVQAEEGSVRRKGQRVACCIFALAVAAIVVAGVVIGVEFPDEFPKYSVAVTAVAGLDPQRDLSARGQPTLSPVFTVTVHVDNRHNAVHKGCVPNLATAVVSYGDVFLGKGTVPQFCVRQRREDEAVGRAWGQDVVVPWFLRDELAAELAVGEATVDVQISMPELLVCRAAKIGGGLSRCS